MLPKTRMLWSDEIRDRGDAPLRPGGGAGATLIRRTLGGGAAKLRATLLLSAVEPPAFAPLLLRPSSSTLLPPNAMTECCRLAAAAARRREEGCVLDGGNGAGALRALGKASPLARSAAGSALARSTPASAGEPLLASRPGAAAEPSPSPEDRGEGASLIAVRLLGWRPSAWTRPPPPGRGGCGDVGAKPGDTTDADSSGTVSGAADTRAEVGPPPTVPRAMLCGRRPVGEPPACPLATAAEAAAVRRTIGLCIIPPSVATSSSRLGRPAIGPRGREESGLGRFWRRQQPTRPVPPPT